MNEIIQEKERYRKALEDIQNALEVATQMFGKSHPITQELTIMKQDLEKANLELLYEVSELKGYN